MNFKDYFELYLEALKFSTPTNFLLDPRNNNKLLQDLENEFQDEGGKVLTNSAFARVYIHPDWNYILKTFLNDPCYVKFARYAFRNPGPNLPKMYGHPQRIVPHFTRAWSSDKLYVIRMEKLIPIQSDYEKYESKYTYFTDIRYANRYPGELRLDNIDEKMKQESEKRDNPEIATDSKLRDLLVTFVNMKEHIKDDEGTYCRVDLHSDNIMARPGSDDLVIIDPYAQNQDISKGKSIINKYGYKARDIESDFRDPDDGARDLNRMYPFKKYEQGRLVSNPIQYKHVITPGGKRTSPKSKKKVIDLFEKK